MQVLRLEELRTQISNDLHDDVGGVLSGIAYQMELLEYSVDDPLKGLVSGIKEASRKAVLRMRDAVWAIDADNDSYREMEDRMKRFAQEMLEPQNIHWRFRTDNLLGKYTLSSDVRHHLLLIFKEFVTNTVKHASASEVLIHITRHGKWLNMHLQDNGTGLTHAQHADGRGLSNIRKRAEQMRAKLEFINSNGFGLRLTVKAF
jgi:signal transduction histidine kinase